MEKIILIKYGELTTKKQNRKEFINQLEKNIKEKLTNEKILLTKTRVRMFIKVENEERIETIIKKLQKIFGIHSIVLAYKSNNNIDTIEENILKIVKSISFKTFKVETKRSNKSFPITSMDFSKRIGGLILKNISNITVNVHNPDYTLKIEIRDNDTYIYGKEYPGAGGYPIGIAGKGLLMLSPPHTSTMAKNKVIDLVEKLKEYQPDIKLHIINFTNIQENIYKNINPDYMITIMRRMMYRISEKVMKKRNCLVLINGESIGQVASQTLTSMQVINAVTNIPVIRPLACSDKLEIIELSKKINTYETSILPYEDCCTIFLPKHPVINPKLEKCIEYEKNFNYEDLIAEALNNMETITKKENETKYSF